MNDSIFSVLSIVSTLIQTQPVWMRLSRFIVGWTPADAHTPSEPLFIYLAYQNVHGPIQAPGSRRAVAV